MLKFPRRRGQKGVARQGDTEVLFFTCATGMYENFVIPYIYFAEIHNPHSRYEFIVENGPAFVATHERALAWLKDHMNVVPTIRDISEVPTRPHMVNAIRFVVEPIQTADYVYIGDVDIVLLENVLDHHRPVFDAGLPYSNVVRPGTSRLTGLHLAEYSKHYPLGEIDDLVRSVKGDEELLYRITERKGLLYDSERLSAVLRGRSPRPVHGIHMSLNRFPFWDRDSRPDWELTFPYAQRAAEILEGEQFASLLDTLHPGPRLAIANLFFIATGVVAGGEESFRRYTQQAAGPTFSGGYPGQGS